MRVMLDSRAATAGSPNYDWAAATPAGVAVVLDGLTEAGGTGCRHGTAWYVHQLGSRLLGYAGETSWPLPRTLAAAIDDVTRLHGVDCDLGHRGSPAATVALVRARGHDEAEYLVLSDAVVVLDTGEEPTVVSDLSVQQYAHMAGATGAGDLAALIAAQQRIRNTPEGYWVAQHDPAAADHAITGTVGRVAGALLLSDGAALAVTDFGAATWRELLDVAYERGPTDVIALTRELERLDPDRRIWPRYKTHDDATAVVWRC